MSVPEQDEPGHTQTVWILLSGGVDSAACLAFYVNQGFSAHCLHLSFGQAAERPERIAAERLAGHFGSPLTVLRWSGTRRLGSGEISGRNAFLYFGALLEIGDRSGLLASGVHAGTRYYDCSPEFLASLQRIVDGYCDGRVRLVAPFLDWTKDQVFGFCTSSRVPLHLTYSCERGVNPPCGRCLSCRDRSTLDDVG